MISTFVLKFSNIHRILTYRIMIKGSQWYSCPSVISLESTLISNRLLDGITPISNGGFANSPWVSQSDTRKARFHALPYPCSRALELRPDNFVLIDGEKERYKKTATEFVHKT